MKSTGSSQLKPRQSFGAFSSVNEIINLGKKVFSNAVDDMTLQLANFVQTQMDVIWSSSKAMELMTASQLQHYQIDCNQYEPNLKAITLSEM